MPTLRPPRAPKLPALKESDVTAQIKGFLESKRWTGFRLQSGLVRGYTQGTFMRLAKKGTPDWVFVRQEMALFVEMKAPGKLPSSHQLAWMRWADTQRINWICADGLGFFIDCYNDRFVL